MADIYSPTSVGMVQILPIHRELANIAATCRRIANDGKRKPECDLGQEKNDRADLVGLLGEFAAITLLERADIRPYYQILSDRPVRGADLKLGDLGLEVKTASAQSRFTFVNLAQHERRQCNYYLIVVLHDTEAEVLKPLSWEEVNRWEVRRDSHSPYLSIATATLPHLTSLRQITDLLPSERPLPIREARRAVEQDSRFVAQPAWRR